MDNLKEMTNEEIASELIHNDRERALCGELLRRITYLTERKNWWQKNAEGIAKERACAWDALAAIEPFLREDMPDGPDGQRGCATPEYRSAYRLLLVSLADRNALLALVRNTQKEEGGAK